MSKKRPSAAQSPMSRLTQELSVLSYSDVPEMSSQASSQAASSQRSCNGEGVYCTPEYQDGDFCTPDDQVQELNWSQGSQDMQQETSTPQQWGLCPPTPDVNKRRKRGGGSRQEKFPFSYILDSLAEEDDGRQASAAAPAKKQQPAAPSKPSKQTSLQTKQTSLQSKQTSLQSWFTTPSSQPSGGLLFSSTSANSSPTSSPPRETASSRHSFPQGQQRKIGASACNVNPFVRESLTEQERRTPSRAVPLMQAGSKASRYLQDFEELRILGRGGAGEVHLARSRMDGCLYAVKRGQAVARSKREKDAVFAEVYAMAAVAGVEHVVRYYGAWYEYDQLHIQMEVCDCTLQERWAGKKADEGTLVRVMQEVGGGLEGLHSRGLAHLDVKAENIYCKGAHFRLGDFGLCFSQALRAQGREPMEGDGRYAAPEAVAGLSQHSGVALFPCDVYSLGATLLELAWGTPLHLDLQDYQDVRGGAAVAIRRPELLGGQPELLAEALTSMLTPDAEQRMTAAEVRSAGQQLWRSTAEGRGEEEGELRALRAEVEELRRRNRVLEKSVEALNCSGTDTSITSVHQDPEPFGSQESPAASARAGPVEVTPPPSGLFDGGSLLACDRMLM